MKYITVSEAANRWNVSPRTVRSYCETGKIDGAYLSGHLWMIPENAQKPIRKNAISKNNLLERLLIEKNQKMSGGIYHKLQIDFTYNSNHIEGSRLSHDQTKYIFETNTIGIENSPLNVDDIIETANHFKCVDIVL